MDRVNFATFMSLWAPRLGWIGAGAAGLAAALVLPLHPAAGVFALIAAGVCAAFALRDPTSGPTSHEAGARASPPVTALTELSPLLEALPDPALLIDTEGRIVASNQAARVKLAFEAAGLRLSSILRQPDLLDAVQAAGEGESRIVEFEHVSQVEEHVRAYVAPMAWGGASAALIVFHDETARIASEQMRADFLANASHELRTPLAALSALIETIAGPARDSPADRDRFLALMQVQADRMKRLINDLLSLSRIEMDEHVPPSDRADLVEVAREAIDAMAGVAGERNVQLVLEETGAARADVVGHRFQLVQVAQNLVDNAIKYSPPGGVVHIEVGVAASREEAVEKSGRRWNEAAHISLLTPAPASARSYAYIRVSDSGPGIARRHLPKLGARFFRVEREEGHDRGGTGLGLAIVKHVMNRHRGGLLVETIQGQGAAFAAYVERAPAPTGAVSRPLTANEPVSSR